MLNLTETTVRGLSNNSENGKKILVIFDANSRHIASKIYGIAILYKLNCANINFVNTNNVKKNRIKALMKASELIIKLSTTTLGDFKLFTYGEINFKDSLPIDKIHVSRRRPSLNEHTYFFQFISDNRDVDRMISIIKVIFMKLSIRYFHDEHLTETETPAVEEKSPVHCLERSLENVAWQML